MTFIQMVPTRSQGPQADLSKQVESRGPDSSISIIDSLLLTPIILATQEAETRSIRAGSQPRQIAL
jgi:hypothetical protein